MCICVCIHIYDLHTKVGCLADGLFLLHESKMYQGPACTLVPMRTSVIVKLMRLELVKTATDVVAHLDLNKPMHHVSYLAGRELQRWG